MYKEYIISQKDDKIDNLSKKIDEQSKEIQELLGYARHTNDRLCNVEEELEDTASKLEDTTSKLEDTASKLEDTITDLSVVQDKLEIAVVDRAVKPKSSGKINQIAILKSDTKYYIICGQATYVKSAIRRKESDYSVSKIIDNVPNSIYLFDHIKKYFKDKIKCTLRFIRLLTITELEFLNDIESLFNGRKNIDLTIKP
jgi:predicted nuclease with TOPRIM domain